MLYTTSLTLVFVLPGDWLLKPSFGLASPKMSLTGPEAVFTANRVRFSINFTPLFLRFLFQLSGLAKFTWSLPGVGARVRGAGAACMASTGQSLPWVEAEETLL